YYVVPRLAKAKIHSEGLGIFVAWAWNLALGVGLVGLVLGYTQAREYAELVWPVDIAIMGVLLLTAYNLYRTILARTAKDLYVTLWYVMGTLIWFPIVYAIGNVIWAPPTGSLTGLNDAIWNWFYGHNVLGLWFTTGTVALIYFIVPKEIKKPIYGYVLALIAFWGIAFFYTAVGTHHILGAPVPEWLKTISVVCSIGLLIPVSAFVVNMFMTMRGSWRVAYYSIPLRFALTGTAFYLMVSVQGSFQALRDFNQFIHFTNWPVAHAHLALLGFVAFSLWGMTYYAIPRIVGAPLHSERLAWTHWWLTTLGFLGFFLVLTAAGLVQAGGFEQGLPIV
ncbi:MAG: cytochrome-c oxidase, partial [Actinobacteria bacterium]